MGQSLTSQTMKNYGIGIIGCGFIGKVHALAYQTLGYYYDPPPAVLKVIGVCAARPETAEAAASKVGAVFGTTSVDELLARNDIQIISVCTPNHLHRHHVLAALKAKKHVYCDKPLASTMDDAREMVAVAAEYPELVTQMTFQYRFAPATLRAKQLVEEGFLGRVFSFRCEYLHAGYIDPERPLSWRMDEKRGGGGSLFDLGSHAIDLMTHLAGDCNRVSASLRTFIAERPVEKGSRKKAPVTVDDVSWLRMEMANGAVGTVEASRMATGTNDELRFEIHGSKGALRWNLMDPAWLEAYDTRDPDGDYGGSRGFKRIECVNRYREPAGFPGPKFSPGWMRFHIASIHDFVRNVAEGIEPGPNFARALHVQAVMEAARESARSGQWAAVEG